MATCKRKKGKIIYIRGNERKCGLVNEGIEFRGKKNTKLKL